MLNLLRLLIHATDSDVAARELALLPEPVIDLQRPNGEIAGSINTRTIQRLMLAHLRMTLSANVQAELIIYDGEQPNALAAIADGRRIIGIKRRWSG